MAKAQDTKELSFRRAGFSDARLLFDWRNDPLTRENSIQTSEVTWAQHQEWLDHSLKNDKREIWIAVVAGQDVGMIRKDLGHISELSWSVAPECRGQGLGSQILTQFVQKHPGSYKAKIKKHNQASLKMAEVAGFKKLHEEEELIVFTINS